MSSTARMDKIEAENAHRWELLEAEHARLQAENDNLKANVDILSRDFEALRARLDGEPNLAT